jgi:uncharacterized protein YndB with AHSA1/START domain
MTVHPGAGTLEPAGDRWRLRFVRELAHPVERVWRAITEPAHLAAWFPQRIAGDWEPGATLTFESEQGPAFRGEVVAVEPPRLLEFTWGTDLIRIEVSERDGGATLTLLDTFGEQGKAARDAAGWHACLDLLGAHLDGAAAPDVGGRWAAVHPEYVGSFGPAAATIGPPEQPSR